MLKRLLVLTLIIYSSFTYAETIKTDVLVIGNGVGAVSAAIQSSRSKLKTVLLVKGDWLANMQSTSMVTIAAGRNIPAGIWGEFRRHVRSLYKGTPGYDTAYNAPLRFEPFAGAGIFKKIADTTTRLTIKLNSPYTSIKKDGTGWVVTIIENESTVYIKAKALIDATETGELVTLVGAQFPSEAAYTDNLYRTSIVCGDVLEKPDDRFKTAYPPAPAYYMPVYALIARDADNLFIADKALPQLPTLKNLPVQIAVGQGVGTMAAFCAFFRTTQKNIRVRLVQNELLDFKGCILPFDDVNPTDKYFRALQQIAATGLLKGIHTEEGNEHQFLFQPDKTVSTAEIKPTLTEIYSRAFIWFNNNKPGEEFTVDNLLSFISEITLADPQSFKIAVQKDWKTKYKFDSDFDLQHQVTRREFAILANQYLNPFGRVVDMSGRIIN